jgi:hypothetical protein
VKKMGNVFENNPSFNDLTEKIVKNDYIEPEHYNNYKVKRGLRNENGTGVLVGLTRIGSVEGYRIEKGEKLPIEGELYFRGINIMDLVSGFQQENRRDEPTNHLDIDSREMLEETLSDFKGTVLFVSHDRYFINKIASRIVEIDDFKFVDYRINDCDKIYDYYRAKRKEKQELKNVHENKKAENIETNVDKPKKKKVNTAKVKLIEKKISEIEEKIENISLE